MAKWHKIQAFFLKLNISGGVKGYKKGRFAYFLANIFARSERKLERYCKTKDKYLSFKLVSWKVGGLEMFCVFIVKQNWIWKAIDTS